VHPRSRLPVGRPRRPWGPQRRRNRFPASVHASSTRAAPVSSAEKPAAFASRLSAWCRSSASIVEGRFGEPHSSSPWCERIACSSNIMRSADTRTLVLASALRMMRSPSTTCPTSRPSSVNSMAVPKDKLLTLADVVQQSGRHEKVAVNVGILVGKGAAECRHGVGVLDEASEVGVVIRLRARTLGEALEETAVGEHRAQHLAELGIGHAVDQRLELACEFLTRPYAARDEVLGIPTLGWAQRVDRDALDAAKRVDRPRDWTTAPTGNRRGLLAGRKQTAGI